MDMGLEAPWVGKTPEEYLGYSQEYEDEEENEEEENDNE